jgi:non-ribosomal peptide synthetase component F
VSPIFQVLFDFQNVPRAPRLSLAGLDVQVAGVDDGAAKLDLVLDLWERDGELVGQAEYASDLFDEATIARLLEQYETLLAHATSDPAARLDELRLQTSAGRARLGDARPRPVVVTDMAPAASPGASR